MYQSLQNLVSGKRFSNAVNASEAQLPIYAIPGFPLTDSRLSRFGPKVRDIDTGSITTTIARMKEKVAPMRMYEMTA